MNQKSKTFVCVASGPSLTQEQVNYCQGKAKVLVINDNYKIAPWADYHYACDQHWWLWHEDSEELLNFQGQCYTQDSSWEIENLERIKQKHSVKVIPSKGHKGLSTDPSYIHQGSHSGYQAINLAYHLGAKRIILIGYDMQRTNGDFHWFGSHPNQMESPWKSWLSHYDDLAKDAERLGLEIINSTIETALTQFPRKELKEAL